MHIAAHFCFGRSPSSFFTNLDSHPEAGLACSLWLLHFARRTLESAYLEKHVSQKVVLADSLGEFAYYWIFAVWIAHSHATSTHLLPSPVSLPLAFCGWTLAELTNFYAHYLLSQNPTKQGSRAPPRSLLFSLVSCPHYLAEILSWTFFVLCCPTLSGISFTFAGAFIMTCYALERHRKYAASDAAFAKSGRAAIVPFVM